MRRFFGVVLMLLGFGLLGMMVIAEGIGVGFPLASSLDVRVGSLLAAYVGSAMFWSSPGKR